MFPRELSSVIRDKTRKLPVVTITGPRQSGKTTLLRNEFSEFEFANLENPREREWAQTDPEDFLQEKGYPLIIDEMQYLPELFSYIQLQVDKVNKSGMYILTGSQNFLLMEKVTQSLAGRVAVLHLLPLSIKELSQGGIQVKDSWDHILNGGYPRIFDKGLSPVDLYPDYINTYLERDVRMLKGIGDLTVFQKFLRVCAGRIGQVINYSSIGNDIGVSYQTVKNWFSVLEASFIVYFLAPYYENFNKRLVKSPKLYFYDTGLACSLLNIETTDQLKSYHSMGSLFENLIISEKMKTINNQGRKPEMYFWRDHGGNEVDLIIKAPGEWAYIAEIKAAKTINKDFFKNLKRYHALSKDDAEYCIIYNGDEEYTRAGISVINWKHS